MAKSVKKGRRRTIEIEDYVARIERTALSYGINNYHHKHEQPYPNRRSLHLFGKLLLPPSLLGMSLHVTLTNREPQSDAPEAATLSRHVAHLEKHGDGLSLYAQVPADYLPTLSAAFHDGRMSIAFGRGPALHRGFAFLTDISFDEERYFVDYWGEPLPSP